MQITPAVKAAAAGIAAAHGTVPANDVGREFHVAITYSNGDLSGYRGRFVDSVDACLDAQEQMAGRTGKVQIRPDVENSFLEGRARFPAPLHPKASAAALDGWHKAQAERAEVPVRIYVVAASLERGVQQRQASRERAYGDQVRGH